MPDTIDPISLSLPQTDPELSVASLGSRKLIGGQLV